MVQEALVPLLARFEGPINFEIIDVFVQPAELNEASERHRTKAVVEMKGSAVLKSNGKKWNNHFAYVAQFDNTSKKIVKVKVYQDSAAVNKAFEE
ncbi:hypothetical protein FRB98_001735 [Tulasnella sp. 332]|nr:hypothetical protein FRB98_001735 [Tulasnella sp. 332]